MKQGSKALFFLMFLVGFSSLVAAQPVDVSETLGLDRFNLLGSSLFLNVLFLIILAVFILGLIATGIILWVNHKKYKYRIPLYTKVGNVPTRIATLKAKPVPFGRAGDQLWYVKGKGVRKWIAPPSIQSAKNEFWHWIREDGEWVNFSMADLDDISQKAGVKYVKQEARLTRLAIDRLLEQRLQGKSFLEKWGLVIGYVLFFLVITIALVIFFHQYEKATESLNGILSKADTILDKAVALERGTGGTSGLIPAGATASLIPLLLIGGNKINRRREWHLLPT